MNRIDRTWAIGVGATLFLVAALPTILAYFAGGSQVVFGAVLFNPLDGNTYLAKAYQGWSGSWLFHLPYTVERGAGAYINLYYIGLGHLSRLLGLPIPLIYNLARLAATLLLSVSLWHFTGATIDDRRTRRKAYAIASLALGMGWMVIPFGQIPADFWVAEAYPLLAALTNPHFPLALALIVTLVNPTSRLTGWKRFLRDLLMAALLGIVSPFGPVIALLPWTGAEAWALLQDLRDSQFSLPDFLRREGVQHAGAILLGGMPVLVYDFVAIRADPVLAAWNSQNINLSPAWWDLLLSFSPALILALFGLRGAPKLLVAWAGLGFALILVPVPIQRRFVMGLSVPLAALAARGWDALKVSNRSLLRATLLLALIPSPLLLFITAGAGIRAQDPRLYLFRSEREAFEWLEVETDEDAVVLAGPQTGLFIPAYTGRRVLYGHPFETMNAGEERAGVENFFVDMGPEGGELFLAGHAVDYVFFGPREAELGGLPETGRLELVYDQGGVKIYAVRP